MLPRQAGSGAISWLRGHIRSRMLPHSRDGLSSQHMASVGFHALVDGVGVAGMVVCVRALAEHRSQMRMRMQRGKKQKAHQDSFTDRPGHVYVLTNWLECKVGSAKPSGTGELLLFGAGIDLVPEGQMSQQEVGREAGAAGAGGEVVLVVRG